MKISTDFAYDLYDSFRHVESYNSILPYSQQGWLPHAAKRTYLNTSKIKDQSQLQSEEALVADLEKALENNTLQIVFQPQVSLKTGQTVGCEALLRWHHPILGAVNPSHFIHIAEKNGLMPKVTYWLINKALKQLRQWHDQGLKLFMSINISPQFCDDALISHLLESLEKFGIPPASIEIELTETTHTTDFSQLAQHLQRLRSKGIKIALDDFGCGYSTLQSLVELPIDVVKIDKTFVQKAIDLPVARLVLQTLINLGREIDAEVVCEGVETKAHRDLVEKLGCTRVQGFFFSRPLAVEAATLWFWNANKIQSKRVVVHN